MSRESKEWNRKFYEGRRKEEIKEIKKKFRPLWLMIIFICALYSPMVIPSPFGGISFGILAILFFYLGFKWANDFNSL